MNLIKRTERLNKVKKSFRKKLRNIALIRFILFILFIYFIIQFATDLKKPYYSILVLSQISLFYYFIKVSGRINVFIENIFSAIHALHHEILRRERKKDSVYKDPDFTELNLHTHFFQDLDLIGSQGLIRTINTTFTKQGERKFIRNLFRLENETYDVMVQRQQFIKTISTKKYFILKSLRLTSGHEKINKIDLQKLDLEKVKFFNHKKILKLFFRPLVVITWALILVHFLTGIPLSSPAILSQIILFAYYRNDSKYELSSFEKGFAKLSDIRKILTYIIFLYDSTDMKFEKKEINYAYLRLEKILFRNSFPSSINFILNFLFLWDLWNLLFLEKWYKEYSIKNKNWLKQVTEFDALVPFAMFHFRNSEFIYPEITQEDKFQAVEMRHPLLEKGVKNALGSVNKGDITIITGSNMAGKTTYLRTIGVNALLGLCGAAVPAKKFILPFNLNILSSIRNQDSLEEGISLFYAEVKKLSYILRIAGEQKQIHLILLDEILKGTNSRERFIASKTVLKYLKTTTSIVFITTHDIELAKLFVNEGIVFKHFTEEIKDGQMHFDYIMKDGIVNSSNALKIMVKEGLKLEFED